MTLERLPLLRVTLERLPLSRLPSFAIPNPSEACSVAKLLLSIVANAIVATAVGVTAIGVNDIVATAVVASDIGANGASPYSTLVFTEQTIIPQHSSYVFDVNLTMTIRRFLQMNRKDVREVFGQK